MDSNLSITIRVNGRQAQQQLRAVAKELQDVQKMVGKKPSLSPASSPWSPAIAKKQATQAANAAKQAAAAQARVTKQAATQSHKMMVTSQRAQARATKQAATQAHRIMVQAQRQQQQVLQRAWIQQQQKYRNHLAKMAAQQRANGATMLRQQKANAKSQAKAGVGGLSPLGFAENLSKSKLVNAGKNINWVGRQLTYNFTLPLAAAGTALFKFNQDVTRSMTGLSKVYGDITEDQTVLKQEIDALATSFDLLSTRFGVHKVEVIDIAAQWAAAGAAGVGLANATRATLETMILGDMDAAAATEGLIAIQAQWRFSTEKNAEGTSELTTQLAYLNAIENATGISTAGLIDVIQRAGGTARTSGASLRELGAMAAALVPATGDAAQAGTALRSIISSLMSPTAAAQEALGLMGITVTDPEWMGAPVTKKLETLAGTFVGLSDAQQAVVSQFISTKWQVSRFDVLMRDVASGTGYYAKALDVTSDATKALDIRNRELKAVLESSPKQWDIMVNAARNAMADAFLPMMPAIMSIVQLIMQLAVAFQNLDPEIQKFILIGLAMIAVLGPIMSLLGSTMQLLGTFGSAFKGAGKAIGWFTSKALWPLMKILGTLTGKFALTFVKVMVILVRTLGLLSMALVRTAATAMVSFLAAIGPIGWAIIGAIALIAATVVLILNTDLEDRVWEIIKSIARAFWALPQAIGNALMAVLRTIGQVMTGIVEALSYLNPFARHSPSLVDNVKNGVSTILDQYSRLRAVPLMIRSAAAALEAFSTSTSPTGQSAREIELRKKANIEGASPAQTSTANSVVDNILALERQLPNLEAEIRAQEAVVEQWTAALKAADLQIEQMEKSLKTLEDQYEAIGDQIAAANNRISELADTPIEGMGALEDQIFANQHAQNLLNMELLEFERQGVSIDSIRDKYAAMAGEIETLRGTQEDLRNAGAGSDVLGWYDQQIAAIEGQRQEMGEVEQTIRDIEAQLDALDLEQRFLDLTRAINFDPLQRQIDQITNQVTEMPFDEIVRQILEQQAIVAELTPEYEALGDQIEREKEAIEAANGARDLIAEKLDVEKEKLDALNDAYSDIKNLIQDMESALGGFGDAMKTVADEASRIEELFSAAEGLDFEDQGGNAPLGREGGLADIEKFNEDLQAEIDEMLRGMGDMDLLGTIQDQLDDLKNLDFLGPIKEAWKKVETWLTGIGQWIKDHLWMVLTAAFYFVGGSIVFFYYGVYKVLTEFVPVIAGWINDHIIQPIWQAIQDGWDVVVGVWNWVFENMLQPVIDFGVRVYNLLAPPIITAWNMIVAAFQWAWGIIEPIFSWIWEQINNYVVPIFELFWVSAQIAFKLAVLALQWLWGHFDEIFALIWGVITNVVIPVFEWLWQRAGEVFGLLGTVIESIWRTVIEPVFNTVRTIIETVVVPAFEWMWTQIDRIWGGIAAAMQLVWDTAFAPIWEAFKIAFETVIQPAFEFLRDSIIRPIMNGIYQSIAWVWNAVAGVIEGGVNFFIEAFNKIAGAVNRVAAFLSIDYEVSPMPPVTLPRIGLTAPAQPGGAGGGGGAQYMAAGGIPPTNRYGGAYNAPRAIVGEGSKIYPEYVIPTDPQYRSRALSYWQQAGTRLMREGGTVPETLYEGVTNWSPPAPPPGSVGSGGGGGSSGSWGGGGGWMDSIMKKLSAAGEWIAKGAIKALWVPGKLIAQTAVDAIPNKFFKDAGSGMLRAVDNWVNGRDQEWDALAPNYPSGPTSAIPGATGPTGSGATAAGIPITHGPGSWKAFTTLLQGMGIPYTNLGTYASRPTAGGNPSMHNYDRAIDLGGSQMQLQRIDHALYDAFAPYMHELIWKGPDARNVYRGKDHVFTPAIANAHTTHIHASMATGGRFHIPNIPGGVNLNVSEGRSGEQVQILPVDDNAMGGTAIIINGNLEFPNVKNGTDAKDFIDNLKALAN